MRSVLLASILVMLAGLAQATDLPKPPDLAAPAPDSHTSEPPSLHAFGDREPGCEEWTDACRTCTRTADGSHNCSNIGPACQPKEVQCARRKAEAPKQDEAPKKEEAPTKEEAPK
jgi:hypothetical protein